MGIHQKGDIRNLLDLLNSPMKFKMLLKLFDIAVS